MKYILKFIARFCLAPLLSLALILSVFIWIDLPKILMFLWDLNPKKLKSRLQVRREKKADDLPKVLFTQRTGWPEVDRYMQPYYVHIYSCTAHEMFIELLCEYGYKKKVTKIKYY